MAKIASMQPKVVDTCWYCEYCWKSNEQKNKLTGDVVWRAICEKQGWKPVDQWNLDPGCPLEDYKPEEKGR